MLELLIPPDRLVECVRKLDYVLVVCGIFARISIRISISIRCHCFNRKENCDATVPTG